jgi:hypothetical protein
VALLVFLATATPARVIAPQFRPFTPYRLRFVRQPGLTQGWIVPPGITRCDFSQVNKLGVL